MAQLLAFYPSGLLFGYFETPELLATARAKMAQTAVNARWQALMVPFFGLAEGAEPGEAPDELMVELEAIFHLP